MISERTAVSGSAVFQQALTRFEHRVPEVEAVAYGDRIMLYLALSLALDVGDTTLLRQDENGRPLGKDEYHLSVLAPYAESVIRILVIICSSKRLRFLKNARRTREGDSNFFGTKARLIGLGFFRKTGFDVARFHRVSARGLKPDECAEDDILMDDKAVCALRFQRDQRTLFVWFNPTSANLDKWLEDLEIKRTKGELDYRVIRDWRDLLAFIIAWAMPVLPAIIRSRTEDEQVEIRSLLTTVFFPREEDVVLTVLMQLFRELQWAQ